MKFGTVISINPDSTIKVSFGDPDPVDDVATLFPYAPVPLEQCVVAEVDGEMVALGAIYNRKNHMDGSAQEATDGTGS